MQLEPRHHDPSVGPQQQEPEPIGARIAEPEGRRSRDDCGFVLVFFALAIVTLLGIAALVVDYGYWSLRADQIQRAADAAALAGVAYMPDINNATTVAETTAADNGIAGSSLLVVGDRTDRFERQSAKRRTVGQDH